MTNKILLKRLIEKTSTDDIEWRMVERGSGFPLFTGESGSVSIRYEHDLTFEDSSTGDKFTLSGQDIVDAGMLAQMVQSFGASIDRQVPGWVVACLD